MTGNDCIFPAYMIRYVAYNIRSVVDTKKSLGQYFKRLHGVLDQIMGREMVDMDLTPAQARILGYLFHYETPPCARDLEEFFELSHPTVSGLLSRMEAKGFIRMEPDEKDKRIKRIRPEEKSRACHERIHRCIEDNDQWMVRGFTQEEKALFESFLIRAVANMEEKSQKL